MQNALMLISQLLAKINQPLQSLLTGNCAMRYLPQLRKTSKHNPSCCGGSSDVITWYREDSSEGNRNGPHCTNKVRSV